MIAHLRHTDSGSTHWLGDDGYPACWHDHRKCAEERVARLETAIVNWRLANEALGALIRRLRRGECWCEMGNGNPMVRCHSVTCDEARCATAALTNLAK